MPYRTCLVAAVVAWLSLAAGSWSQTTAPATQPTEPDPRVVDLARGLSDDDFATRQRSEDALVALGPSIEPSLQLLLERATDEEVRSRLQSALARIVEQRRIGPTRITLHLKDASAKEAFTALWAQVGKPLPGQGDVILLESSDKVTLDCVDEPFWSVMLKLTELTGIGLQGTGDGSQLVWHGRRATPPHAVSGAFLVQAESAQRTYVIQYSNGNATSSDFSVNFSVWPEPKLDVAAGPGARSVKIARAEDEHGREMFDNQGGGGWRSGGAINFAVRLRSNHADAKRLAVIAGSVTVPVNLRYASVEHDKLNETVTHRVGDVRITIEPIKKVNDRMYQIKLTAYRDGATDEAWSLFNHQIFSSVRIEDADRQPLDRGGWGSAGGDGIKIEGTLNYTRSQRGDKDTGEPVRLIWRIPVETREIEVPFELRDLPLPG